MLFFILIVIVLFNKKLIATFSFTFVIIETQYVPSRKWQVELEDVIDNFAIVLLPIFL